MAYKPSLNIEVHRVTFGIFASNPIDSPYEGAWEIPVPAKFRKIANTDSHYKVIASNQMSWEHVSVSMSKRCLTWEEMCFIKKQFWGPEDTVLQFHPPESECVNNHKFTLHLWRKCGENMQTPASILVGLK